MAAAAPVLVVGNRVLLGEAFEPHDPALAEGLR
jgi:hypothetical protein